MVALPSVSACGPGSDEVKWVISDDWHQRFNFPAVLIGWQEGHLACKNLFQLSPRFSLGKLGPSWNTECEKKAKLKTWTAGTIEYFQAYSWNAFLFTDTHSSLITVMFLWFWHRCTSVLTFYVPKCLDGLLNQFCVHHYQWVSWYT